MTDTTSRPPVGASSWERELYTHLTDHVRTERDVLRAYVAAADATDSKALAYLVRILIEDERRHHRWYEELADSLKHDAEFRDGHTAVPWLDFHGDAAVRGLTDQLIDREQEDLRAQKELQKDLRDVKDTTLWSLLVDLMQHDTKRHIAMLRFVQKHI